MARSASGGSSGPGGIDLFCPAARAKTRSRWLRTWSASSKVMADGAPFRSSTELAWQRWQ